MNGLVIKKIYADEYLRDLQYRIAITYETRSMKYHELTIIFNSFCFIETIDLNEVNEVVSIFMCWTMLFGHTVPDLDF